MIYQLELFQNPNLVGNNQNAWKIRFECDIEDVLQIVD